MADLYRWVVAVEMLTLLACLTGIVGAHQDAARRLHVAWRWGGAAVMIVLAGVTAAVVTNALIAGPQTPGVRLLAVIAAPAVIAGLIGLVLAVRHPPPPSDADRLADLNAKIAALDVVLTHIGHLPECPDAGCIWARERLAELRREINQPHP